jgi:hypothetical protein
MIKFSGDVTRATVCPHGSRRAGCRSANPYDSSSAAASLTASGLDSSNSKLAWGIGRSGGHSSQSKTRLGDLLQRPDAEVLAAADCLAVVIVVALRVVQGQTERVDVQATAGEGIDADCGDTRDELDLHGSSTGVDAWCGGVAAAPFGRANTTRRFLTRY